MSQITQDTRLLELQTPLGRNVLLIRSIQGREAISQLYSFEVECFAGNDVPIDFSKLVGQPVYVSAALRNNEKRYFHGIVKSFARGVRTFSATSYRFELVPSLWLWTQRTQSRIFQQITVPDILKKVLEGLDVDIQITGDFEPRDYCVQYRESDFAFASRLMEEEGIFYFFRHREDGHTLVLANTPQSHEDLPFDKHLCFDEERGGVESHDEIVYAWEKQQTLKPGKVTLWDHSFELPHKSLDAQELVDDDLMVGEVQHKLKIAGNDKLELYDYPGGYAQRFDGISPSGGERLHDLQKIYEDNQRTAKIRMRQETSGALQITGSTGYLNMCPGFQFDLARHYSDDDAYVITAASVAIPQRGDYAGDSDEFSGPPPEIVFNCIPVQLPYVPQRVTAKPSIFGTQTAVVVGPDGEEIFTDKYGRVKVQFLWDREGKFNGNSSCWVRVASPWAGKQWGMVHIPRIGQEVVVAFEEGDPDQPIIVGSVYNADQMPPYELPANKTQSGTKSRSTPNAGPNNLNEIRFEDKIGHEHIFIHSEKDTHFRCKGAYLADIGGSFDETIHGDSRVERKGKSSLRVGGDSSHIVHGNRTDFCDQDAIYKAKGTLGLKGDHFRLEGRIGHIGATDDILIDVGSTLAVSASDGIHLKCGNSVLSLTPSGIYISSAKVYINSGSAVAAFTVASKPAIVQADAPRGPMKAGETLATVNPAGGMDSEGNRHNPNDEENKDKTHWVEVELLDESGAPVEGESCEITLPNGKKTTASTNAKGVIRVEKIDPGDCTFRWINLDRDAVNKK